MAAVPTFARRLAAARLAAAGDAEVLAALEAAAAGDGGDRHVERDIHEVMVDAGYWWAEPDGAYHEAVEPRRGDPPSRVWAPSPLIERLWDAHDKVLVSELHLAPESSPAGRVAAGILAVRAAEETAELRAAVAASADANTELATAVAGFAAAFDRLGVRLRRLAWVTAAASIVAAGAVAAAIVR